ncbi:MAG: outer membrane protein [Pseudolabrys sp.]|jgi:outer membrane immunogenic protein
MKKFLLASAGLLSLGIASAQAADMPARMATKAPVYTAPALYNWTGPYVGINGGGSFGSGSNGGLVGGTLGYNFQTGPWVYGLEGDMNWIKANDSSVRNNWLATVRGRFGYAMGSTGSILPYLTGGVAFGDIENSVAGLGTVSDSKTGWTLGGGVEAAISGPLTAKVEYLYVDLGDGPTLAGVGSSYHTNIIRAGLNYRF